jgi:hypothetical protein
MVSGEVLIDRVSTAYWNTRHMPNVYLVQGDIYHPPLAAPIRFYYSEGEVERLAQNGGISDVKVTPMGLSGWRACGIRR